MLSSLLNQSRGRKAHPQWPSDSRGSDVSFSFVRKSDVNREYFYFNESDIVDNLPFRVILQQTNSLIISPYFLCKIFYHFMHRNLNIIPLVPSKRGVPFINFIKNFVQRKRRSISDLVYATNKFFNINTAGVLSYDANNANIL